MRLLFLGFCNVILELVVQLTQVFWLSRACFGPCPIPCQARIVLLKFLLGNGDVYKVNGVVLTGALLVSLLNRGQFLLLH